MRRSEILSLIWDKVDLKERMIRLESADTKKGLSKKVPISKALKNILIKPPRDYIMIMFFGSGESLSGISERV